MNFEILEAIGGLGLFLFGMTTLTESLRALTDDKLREILSRTVSSPTKGAVTGALATAVLQSSSATTVAAVGFVGAGLMTFPQSLGIIFGANIGTTMTGWVVALIGFKLDLGQVFLPLIFAGVLLRMAGRQRLKLMGLAIAGFGLIFVGIDMLQAGLQGLQGDLTPGTFPPDTIVGRVLLVFIGLVITLVTQSSSAGVATALAAVSANAISLNQAAAMVIGMDVGTTATAALATLGGNVHAQRTGFAHVIYNSITGVLAFLMLSPFMAGISLLMPEARDSQPELVLVAFHSFFNFVGVIAALPLTSQFANLIERTIPERGNRYTGELDRSLLLTTPVASMAVENTLRKITFEVLHELRRILHNPQIEVDSILLSEIKNGIEEVRTYVEDLAAGHDTHSPIDQSLANIHVMDHLHRICRRMDQRTRLQNCRKDSQLSQMADRLITLIDLGLQAEPQAQHVDLEQLATINDNLKSLLSDYRQSIIRESTTGHISTSVAFQRLDTARALRRVGRHIFRIHFYLAGGNRTDLTSVTAQLEVLEDEG